MLNILTTELKYFMSFVAPEKHADLKGYCYLY